jgi:phosphatidylglycerol lysyltransferase
MIAGAPNPDQLERARALVLRHGWNATAYQILNPGMRLWFSEREGAVAGLVERHGIWVVAGAPVCAPEALTDAVAELESAARRTERGICYFCAGERLYRLLGADPRHDAVRIGAQPAWNPAQWPELVAGHASLRQQLNRARNKGVRVSEWPAERAAGHPALHRALEEWLAGKGLPPLHFLVEPETLSRLYDRRVWVAQREEAVAGFLVASPVPRRRGCLIEQFVRGAAAPNGTTELMIDAAVRAMRAAGDEYVTLGLSPLSDRAGPPGENAAGWLRFLLGWTRAHVHRFYNFEGLEAFKAKFRPSTWEPMYAIAGEPTMSPRTLYAIAAAFSDGSVPSTLGRAVAGALRQEARWLRRQLGG